MSKHRILIVIAAVCMSVALMACTSLVHSAFGFNSFAEVILKNDSGEMISEAELTRGDLTVLSRNIPPGEERLLRFYPHQSFDSSGPFTVHLASGRVVRGSCFAPQGGEETLVITNERSYYQIHRRSTSF